ncbi:hypothetical protein [Photobacterium sanguinicancri]|uniref:DUF2059 domain-containing protein n=1 Tax=Photobacterium sanguinicancri TaxID=875932 RepID=A0AAW7YBH7_9GAMM|nr:hypothetical protein [Photobacterium sanguinicancri]MDO6544000.1 hypothetical protein [Photobacterium sanguinicancri]
MFRVIVLLVTLAALPVFSSPERDSLKLDWMMVNHSEIELILGKKETVSVIPIINTLVDIWSKRDGGISGEVSPLIVNALTTNTEYTLSMMSDYPDSFQDWLEELDGIVFTDLTGLESEHLNQEKDNLVQALKNYTKNGNSDLGVFAQRLIKRLESISIQVVD